MAGVGQRDLGDLQISDPGWQRECGGERTQQRKLVAIQFQRKLSVSKLRTKECETIVDYNTLKYFLYQSAPDFNFLHLEDMYVPF